LIRQLTESLAISEKMILPLNRPVVVGHGFGYFPQEESIAGSNASLRLVVLDGNRQIESVIY
jgi:hypothetical protein